MSIQYTALGFEPTTFRTRVSSHSHQTRAPAIIFETLSHHNRFFQHWVVIAEFEPRAFLLIRLQKRSYHLPNQPTAMAPFFNLIIFFLLSSSLTVVPSIIGNCCPSLLQKRNYFFGLTSFNPSTDPQKGERGPSVCLLLTSQVNLNFDASLIPGKQMPNGSQPDRQFLNRPSPQRSQLQLEKECLVRLAWTSSGKILAWLYSIMGLVAAYQI